MQKICCASFWFSLVVAHIVYGKGPCYANKSFIVCWLPSVMGSHQPCFWTGQRWFSVEYPFVCLHSRFGVRALLIWG